MANIKHHAEEANFNSHVCGLCGSKSDKFQAFSFVLDREVCMQCYERVGEFEYIYRDIQSIKERCDWVSEYLRKLAYSVK